MITILWTELGGDRWEQCGRDEAERLMKRLQKNPDVVFSDVIVFFDSSFGSSCYGDTYNLPIGTVIEVISEKQLAVIMGRELTDIGIKYNIIYDTSTLSEVYDRNIEVLKIGNGVIDENWKDAFYEKRRGSM